MMSSRFLQGTTIVAEVQGKVSLLSVLLQRVSVWCIIIVFQSYILQRVSVLYTAKGYSLVHNKVLYTAKGYSLVYCTYIFLSSDSSQQQIIGNARYNIILDKTERQDIIHDTTSAT